MSFNRLARSPCPERLSSPARATGRARDIRQYRLNRVTNSLKDFVTPGYRCVAVQGARKDLIANKSSNKANAANVLEKIRGIRDIRLIRDGTEKIRVFLMASILGERM